MKIDLKSSAEIEKMSRGGKIAAEVLERLKTALKPGVRTNFLDRLAEELILTAQAKPSFKGYQKYPASICVSVNDGVVHGLPGNRILEEGDLVSLDLGVFYQGYHTDTAATFACGRISTKARLLLEVTRRALEDGVKESRAGKFLGDVQFAIQKTVESAGFKVVRDLTGHGIGKNLQEAPPIANFGQPGRGPELLVGMTLALEPMVTAGDCRVKVLEDGWTVVTADGSLSSHFEHTIAITESGPEILTQK